MIAHRYALLVALGFAVVTTGYTWKLGIRFHASPLRFYIQFIDPELLRSDLARSLFYLRDQPPLFNLFLGLVLKAFPRSSERAFHVAYIAMGAAGTLASYALARRLRAGPRASVAIALVICAAPTTVLYEHWLFYAYPLAVLWIGAALALLRVLSRPTAGRAFVATGVLALIALTRGTVHLVVVLGVVGALALARRREARSILVGAALPMLLVIGLYVKHALVFGGIVVGGFFRGVNVAEMQMAHIDEASLDRLASEGRIPPGCPPKLDTRLDLNALIASAALDTPRPRGVPILDRPRKSTGMTNWNSSAAEVVGEACDRAARALAKERPEAYGAAVRTNIWRFLMPADREQPLLLGRGVGAERLKTLRTAVDPLALVVGPHETSLVVLAGLTSALLLPCAGAMRLARLRKRTKHRAPSPELLVALFTAVMLVYQGLVVILFSMGDQNRYRAEVMPLVWVVVGASLWRTARTVHRARRKLRVSASGG